MSLIELLLSRKEVVLSLAVIGLILLALVMLALTPALIRSWKKRTARQKAEKAARIARNKKNKRKQQRANATPRPRPIEVLAEQNTSAPETVSPPVIETHAVPPPPVIETPIVLAPEEDEEEIPEVTSSLQDVLDSVFTDDENVSRYEVLLKDVEPVSAGAVLDLAAQVADELAALSAQRRQS